MVRSSTVSSKLSSGKWPHPDGVANKIVRTLQQWGALQQQQHQQQPRTCSPSGSRFETSESSGQKEHCTWPDTGTQAIGQVGHELVTRRRQDGGKEGPNAAPASALASSEGTPPVRQNYKTHVVKGLPGPVECSMGCGPVGGGSGDSRPENERADSWTDANFDSIGDFMPKTTGRSIDAANSVGAAVTSAVAPTMETFSLGVEDITVEVSGHFSHKVPYMEALEAFKKCEVYSWDDRGIPQHRR